MQWQRSAVGKRWRREFVGSPVIPCVDVSIERVDDSASEGEQECEAQPLCLVKESLQSQSLQNTEIIDGGVILQNGDFMLQSVASSLPQSKENTDVIGYIPSEAQASSDEVTFEDSSVGLNVSSQQSSNERIRSLSHSPRRAQSFSDKDKGRDYSNLWRVYRSAENLLREEEKKERARVQQRRRSQLKNVYKSLSVERELNLNSSVQSEQNIESLLQSNEAELLREDRELFKENLAWTSIENRNFLKIKLGNFEYRALFDPGATVSLISAGVAENFKERLLPIDSFIETALGNSTKCLGKLKINLVVDGKLDHLNFKVLDGIKHEIILGMDFMKKWDIEVKNKMTQWRVGESILQDGFWHNFNNENNQRTNIYGECAGICELNCTEKEMLNEVVENVLKESQNKVGTTNLIEHEIILKQGAKPVRQKPRRMSNKVWEYAKKEVDKMLEDDIIERSKSDWCARPVIVSKSNGDYRFCVDYRDLI